MTALYGTDGEALRIGVVAAPYLIVSGEDNQELTLTEYGGAAPPPYVSPPAPSPPIVLGTPSPYVGRGAWTSGPRPLSAEDIRKKGWQRRIDSRIWRTLKTKKQPEKRITSGLLDPFARLFDKSDEPFTSRLAGLFKPRSKK